MEDAVVVTTDVAIGMRLPSPGGREMVSVGGGLRDPVVEDGKRVLRADDWPMGD